MGENSARVAEQEAPGICLPISPIITLAECNCCNHFGTQECVEEFLFPGWRLGWLLLLFSHQVLSDSTRSHGLQHTRLPCPSPSPGVCPSSCPLTWLVHRASFWSVSALSAIVATHPSLLLTHLEHSLWDPGWAKRTLPSKYQHILCFHGWLIFFPI